MDGTGQAWEYEDQVARRDFGVSTGQAVWQAVCQGVLQPLHVADLQDLAAP